MTSLIFLLFFFRKIKKKILKLNNFNIYSFPLLPQLKQKQCMSNILFCLENKMQSSASIKDQKAKNPKIGRPCKSENGLQFKKQYLENQLKFELECELIATLHEMFFIDPPTDPSNRRMEIQFLTVLFEEYECLDTFKILLDLNQFFYKNSSCVPEDSIHYTSFIDVGYMFRELRVKRGPMLRSVELVLTILFFMYNQKLVNMKCYNYIKPLIGKIAFDMVFAAPLQTMGKIQMLIINLIVEIAIKEGIKILH